LGVVEKYPGIGHIDGITGIFCDHISDALDVIPL